MSNDVYPINKFIAPEDPDLIDFCRTINPLKKPVVIPCVDYKYPLGLCYWNAHDYVQKHGGEVVYGWLFSVWPGCYIDAMHHAVIRNSDGNLVDITPQMQGYDFPDKTVFLEDDSIRIDLQRQPNIPNKAHVLSSSIATKNMISTYDKLVSLNDQLTQIMYDLGYREEANFQLSRGEYNPASLSNINRRLANSFEFKVVNEIVNNQKQKLASAIKLLKSQV